MSDENEIEVPVKQVDESLSLSEKMTENAYERILPERYLVRDEEGNLQESQDELFERVAKNVALAEVVYSDESVMVQPQHIKDNHSRRDDLAEKVFGMGTELDDDAEVEINEKNAKYFSYDNVINLLSKETREEVEKVKNDFLHLMENLRFTPNSPTLMNAGDELQQLSACFVDSPADDMDDIHDTAKEAALVFQSGGGMGYAFWQLRPYGDKVGSTGGIASGPITFMNTYDQMCETVAQGGTRRGAQMGVMKVSHPDVIFFIHAKNKDVSLAQTLRLNDPDDPQNTDFGEALEEAREHIDEDGMYPEHLRNAVEGHLSNFNISVGITDDFMEALQAGEDFTMTNPRTGEPHIANEHTKEMYEWFDMGEEVEVGEPLEVSAEKLWNRMVEGAHENGEPGVLYLERANKEHSFDVEENEEYEMLATNPCGEQYLMEYEACNLGHINLSTILDEDSDVQYWSEFEKTGDLEEDVEGFLEKAIDWDEFNHRIRTGTRFLENVVTMSDFPIDKIEETVANNRKIGLGIMGLAQMYLQMKVRYGDEIGNEISRQLMTHINHHSKLVSRELAEERGKFNNWEDSKYANPTEYADWFKKQTGEDPEDWEDGFPMRNHNTTTIAPTGTTSMVANTTGGCEPMYNVAYLKNVSEDIQGDEMLVEFDDYFLRVLKANDIDIEPVKEEAYEQMMNNEFEGVGSLSTVPEEIGELFVVTGDLSGKEHAAVQCALQEGVDSSISKTCNFPNDATVEDMREVYEYIYEHGGKGVTVYRDGTRAKQVLTTRSKNIDFADDEELIDLVSEKAEDNEDFRYELAEMLADVSGEQENLLEDFAEGLAEERERLSLSEYRKRPDNLIGATIRITTGYGTLYVTLNEDENGNLFEVFAEMGKSGGVVPGFTEALGRMISMSIRYGVPPERVVKHLEGIRSPKFDWDNGERVDSIPDAIAMAIDRYLERGGVRGMLDTQMDDESFEGTGIGTSELSIEQTKLSEPEDEATGQPAEQEREAANQTMTGEPCPDCGTMMVEQEGCKKCTDCGFSEC